MILDRYRGIGGKMGYGGCPGRIWQYKLANSYDSRLLLTRVNSLLGSTAQYIP
jgi:hypothetical protein